MRSKMLSALLGIGESEPQIAIELNRDMSIEGEHFSRGTIIDMGDRVGKELIADGSAARIGGREEFAAERERLNALVPARPSNLPMPTSWGSLPKCFADWWALDQELSALIAHGNMIHEALMAVRSPWILKDAIDMRDIAHGQRAMLADAVARGLYMGPPPPATIRSIKHLEATWREATDRTNDWRTRKRAALIEATLDCSNTLIAVHASALEAVIETRAAALAVFAARVAPLGLADCKVAGLFQGSADFMNLGGDIALPHLECLRMAYYDNVVGSQNYVDRPVPTMVSIIEPYRALEATAKAKQAIAVKELAKVRKAVAA